MKPLTLALLLGSGSAAAATVPVDVVGLEGDVRLVQKDTTHRCHAPCTMNVTPGEWMLIADSYEESLLVDGPATLRFRPGSRTGRSIGGGIAAGGALVVVGLTYALFRTCEGRTGSDGNYYYPCDRPAGRTAQLVLIGGTGVGITAMVVGGFLFFGSGPSVRVTDRGSAAGGTRLIDRTSVTLAPTWGGGVLSLDVRF